MSEETTIQEGQMVSPSQTPVSVDPISVPTVHKSANAKPILFVFLGLLAAAIIGVAGYIGYSIINLPTRVKEQAMPIQKAIADYDRVVGKISDHLKDESDTSTAEELEREVKKAETLIKESKQAKEQMDAAMAKMTLKPVKGLKASAEEYAKASQSVVDAEQAGVDLYTQLIPIVRKSDDMGEKIGEAANDIYNDPDSFVDAADDIVKDMDSMIEDVKKITVPDDYKGYFDAFVSLLELTRKSVVDMRDAVDNRDVRGLIKISENFSKDMDDASDALERESDNMDEKIADKIDVAESAKSKFDEAYSGVRSKYNF